VYNLTPYILIFHCIRPKENIRLLPGCQFLCLLLENIRLLPGCKLLVIRFESPCMSTGGPAPLPQRYTKSYSPVTPCMFSCRSTKPTHSTDAIGNGHQVEDDCFQSRNSTLDSSTPSLVSSDHTPVTNTFVKCNVDDGDYQVGPPSYG
jgi:hypothetical protein